MICVEALRDTIGDEKVRISLSSRCLCHDVPADVTHGSVVQSQEILQKTEMLACVHRSGALLQGTLEV